MIAKHVAPFVVALVLALATVNGVHGWWCTGHMLTAQIAGFVAPEAAQYFQPEIDNWSQQWPNIATLPEAACWADDFKKYNRSFNEWHYYNGCFSADGTPCPAHPGGLLLKALPLTVQVLSDPDSSLDDRSFYFMYLIHLVGDLHQPLHTATEWSAEFPDSDRGGNEFHVHYGSNYHEVLHAWCDSVGMLYHVDPHRPFSEHPSSKEFIEDHAKVIMSNYTFSPSHVAYTNVSDFNVWASQSFAAAVSKIYLEGNLHPGDTLNSTYIAVGRDILQSQISLGGYRLASVLKYLHSSVKIRRSQNQPRKA